MVSSFQMEESSNTSALQMPPDEDRMIDERISIHDKYQFEAKLVYHLNLLKKYTTYEIETYFFLPQNLHVNSSTYSKEQFYSDIQSYLRLKTPSVPLNRLAEGENNPLSRLMQSMEELRIKPGSISIVRYEHRLRLFCCVVKSCLRDHVAYIGRITDISQIADYIGEYMTRVRQVLGNYRSLEKILSQTVLDENHQRMFAFGDEYLSMLAEDSSYEIIQAVENLDFPDKTQLQSDLVAWAKEEIEYRRKRGFPSIPSDDSDNEEFIFRKGTLKKYMGSVLFLNTRIEKEGRLLEQILLGVAAGLAMLFATAVAFFYQYRYGVLSLPFFVALIISYMFKDRIKELSRLYLATAARSHLFDHKTNIYAKKNMKIGYCRESFDFIAEDKISPTIRILRNRDRISELEDDWLGESIIRYRKQIRIFSSKIQHIYHGALAEGLTDIMRMNIQQFLGKMDNPKKDIFLPDGNFLRRISGRRVYHVNMIINYREDHESILERYRIVLNRAGIKRIEMVDSIRISGTV